MVPSRCYRLGVVSATTVLLVAGSASLFGWLLLLPPTKFPSAQEPAPAPIVVEAPAGPTQPCSPENAAKLQELMALRARIGTNIGTTEDFQTALASLIEQEQATTSREAMPALVPSIPLQPAPNSVPWSSPRTNVHPLINIHPPTQGQSNPHVHPPTSPGYTQPFMMAEPPMVVPNQFVIPPHIAHSPALPYPHAQFPGTENAVGPRQEVLIQQFRVPQQPNPERAGSPAVQSSIGDEPVRISFHESNQEVRRNVDRHIEDRVRENPRPSMGPDRSHRVRQAARRLEEAAWELEEVGEYSLADELRRKATELYHRARRQPPVHQ